MKILTIKKNWEYRVRKSCWESGIECVIPTRYIKKRLSRKSNKKVETEQIVATRVAFANADADRLKNINGVQKVWRKNNKWIEVSPNDVDLFIDAIRHIPKKIDGQICVGSIITLSLTIDTQIDIKIHEINGNKIKGVICGDGLFSYPISTFI